MQHVKDRLATINPAAVTNLLFGILVRILLLFITLYAINAMQAPQRNPLPSGAAAISQATLEEKYGLQVNLVAVTAAGGFVDVRLKILEGDKAKFLLQDRNNFPSLFTEDATRLSASQEVKEDEIHFEKNSNLFIMFPNARNAVKPGTQVRIIFGDLALEPLVVQ